MYWRLRIMRGTLYSHMPFGRALRRWKRRISPPTAEDPNTGYAIHDGIEQLALLARAGADPHGSVVEVGTGWLPVIPLLFHLVGYRRIVLTDTEPLMDAATIAIAMRSVQQRAASIAELLGRPEAAILAELGRPFAPEYLAPWNPGGVDIGMVDTLISRCVFEHIRPDELRAIVTAFRRVVRPGGLMCHVVDNSDHWQHIHHARSRVAFLRWPQGGLVERFAALNNYGYTNRLRHADYVELFRETGWEVVTAHGDPDARALAELPGLRLAPPFDRRDPADLAILRSCFVLRNPANA